MISLSRALLAEQDFSQLINRIDGGGCPVVYSGLGGIHKAHVAAAIRRITSRPVFVICADEAEAEKLRADISVLCQEEVFRLMRRELSFYNVDSVSREAEHERIRVLSMLSCGTAGVVVATVEGMLTRTIPKAVFQTSSLTLHCSDEPGISSLCEKLLACGYRRCDQVEGTGQFAVRGGIVDFYSPSFSFPVRCEFFGDEIDSMGLFDVSTQRRLENIFQADILPCAESLPSLCCGGEAAFAERLEKLIEKQKRRKNPNEQLISSLSSDLERLRSQLPLSTADRYMPLIYDSLETAANYIPESAVVILSEPARIEERGKNFVWQLSQDLEALLSSGIMDGSLSECFIGWPDCCSVLENYPIVMLDNFLGSSYPVAPRALLNLTAKQLPSYGGSIQTAAGDIVHYLRENYRVIVLCSDNRKAEILNEYLSDHKLPCGIDYNLSALPAAGTCAISVGVLSAGNTRTHALR